MVSDLEKARFWADYLVAHGDYKDAPVLAKHLENARFYDFCTCGCCSFRVENAPLVGLDPLLPPTPKSPDSHFGFHSFERKFLDGRTLAVTAFADERGMLWGIDVDVNCNTEPVPEPFEAARLLGL